MAKDKSDVSKAGAAELTERELESVEGAGVEVRGWNPHEKKAFVGKAEDSAKIGGGSTKGLSSS